MDIETAKSLPNLIRKRTSFEDAVTIAAKTAASLRFEIMVITSEGQGNSSLISVNPGDAGHAALVKLVKTIAAEGKTSADAELTTAGVTP